MESREKTMNTPEDEAVSLSKERRLKEILGEYGAIVVAYSAVSIPPIWPMWPMRFLGMPRRRSC